VRDRDRAVGKEKPRPPRPVQCEGKPEWAALTRLQLEERFVHPALTLLYPAAEPGEVPLPTKHSVLLAAWVLGRGDVDLGYYETTRYDINEASTVWAVNDGGQGRGRAAQASD